MSRQILPRFFSIVAIPVTIACSAFDTTAPEQNLETQRNAFSQDVATPGWHAVARGLVAANVQSPLVAGRVYAALGVAQYAAVNDVGANGTSGQLKASGGFGNGGRDRYEAERGAVAGASAQVLSFFYPAAAADLEQRVLFEGQAGPGRVHPAFKRGVEIGRAAGNRIIERVKADGFTTPWTGTIPTGPGIFVPNGPPAGPQLGSVTPYFLTSGSQFRSAPPPTFQSPAFQADLDEVVAFSNTRTPQQLAIALKWNYGNGTYTPVGYWNELAGKLIEENNLNEREAAHVFALVSATGFDALIGCWESKYHYWYIRPWQANTTVTLPIGAPNHPSYPSGHSCVSSAMASVLGHFFPSMQQQLDAEVTEAGMSRIYGGIHYRFDITAGEELGRATAQLAIGIDQANGLLSVLD